MSSELETLKTERDKLAVELAEARDLLLRHRAALGAAERERDEARELEQTWRRNYRRANEEKHAERERADKYKDALDIARDNWEHFAKERDQARAECERLKATGVLAALMNAERLQAERDRYRAEVESLRRELDEIKKSKNT